MAETGIVKLQKRVRAFLNSESPPRATDSIRRSAVEVLTRPVRRGWRTYLVGGFLRDLVLASSFRRPRDFDVIVEGCSPDALSEVFNDIISGQNRFGGLTLRRWTELQGAGRRTWELDFDVWRLEDTWAVRHLQLPHTIQAFVLTPFLNVDSIAMAIAPGQDYLTVFERGFFDALARGCVEINQIDNPFPVLCAARGLIMAARLDFAMGPKLAAFVYNLAETVEVEEFVAAQIGHYGQLKYSRRQLSRWLLDVRTQLEAGREQVNLTTDRAAGTVLREPTTKAVRPRLL